ncbi:MAG: hypothetical protein R3C68_16465 [Myxococcota bacterium]
MVVASKFAGGSFAGSRAAAAMACSASVVCMTGHPSQMGIEAVRQKAQAKADKAIQKATAGKTQHTPIVQLTDEQIRFP